jgi:hypothetical protein
MAACLAVQTTLKHSPMHFLRAVALLLLLARLLAAGQPAPILPDPKLTPGDTFDVTVQDVCVPGYAKKVRAVPAWLKRQAYAEYEITEHELGDYEVDHLIALSFGVSNSIRNLWPQSTRTSPWNSFVKDALERKLHELVCAGQLDLKTAQREIASNWIDAYQKYVGKAPPAQSCSKTLFEVRHRAVLAAGFQRSFTLELKRSRADKPHAHRC